MTNKAKDFISSRGYSSAFGARSLKRAIQMYLLNPLSSKLISMEFKEGDSIIIDAQKKNIDNLEFKKKCIN